MDLLQASPESIGSTLRLSLVSDPARLESLRPEWDALLRASAHPEPVLSPDWLLTWWREYGRGRSLCVGLFRDGRNLVGLVPLVKRRVWYRPGIPFRRLEFLGADVDEHDGVCSDYLNVIARAGAEREVARALAEELAAGAFGGWDELVLSRMDGLGPMPEHVTGALGRMGLRADATVTGEAAYIPLPASWSEYLAALPKKKRYGITRALRDLEAWSGGTIDLHWVSTRGDLPHARQILVGLHKARWEAAGARGAFHSARFTAFHQTLMPVLFEKGELELLWLEVRGRPIAAMYNFVVGGKVYFYQSGRALDVPKGQRPGIALIALAIQRALARRAREFDFLSGDEMYKADFALASRPLVEVRAVRPCWIERVRRLTDRGIRGLRALRDRVRRTFGTVTTPSTTAAVNAD